MTCIVGIVDSDKHRVILAADSRGLFGPDEVITTRNKLVRLEVGGDENDVAYIGLAGEGAITYMAQFHLVVAEPDQGDIDRWAQLLAEQLTRLALDHGFTAEKEPNMTSFSGLLAYQDRLWLVGHHTAVPVERRFAVGSGGGPALAALQALEIAYAASDPERAARTAVEAVLAVDSGCGEPVVMATTELPGG